MRLTAHTDYALRVMMYLGLRPGRRVTIHEVAERYGISENHLMKVVNRLGSLGYVETVRGKNGGFWLARPATKVRIGALVRDMEEGFDLVECFRADGACPISEGCTLQGILSQSLAAFLGVLNSYTLADLLRNAESLGATLQLMPELAALPRNRASR